MKSLKEDNEVHTLEEEEIAFRKDTKEEQKTSTPNKDSKKPVKNLKKK